MLVGFFLIDVIVNEFVIKVWVCCKKILLYFVLIIYNGKIVWMLKISFKRFVIDNEILKENMEIFEILSDNNNFGFSLG